MDKIDLVQGWESWEPFTYKDDQGILTGLDIEIVKHIFSEPGQVVTYIEAPWPRQLKWLEEGVIHITGSSMKTPEREVYAFFSDPYYKERYFVYVRKGETANYRMSKLSDIMGSSFRLGVMRGSLYGVEFDQLKGNPSFMNHVEEVATDEQNFTKLLLNRLDGFILEASRMSIEGRRKGIWNKVEPLFLVEENDLHFMISKNASNPEILTRLNAGLKAMRLNGTYQAIFTQFKMDEVSLLTD